MKELKAKVPFVPGDTAYMIYKRAVVEVRIQNVIVRFYDMVGRIHWSSEYIVIGTSFIAGRDSLENIPGDRLFDTIEEAETFLDDYLGTCNKVKEFEEHMGSE